MYPLTSDAFDWLILSIALRRHSGISLHQLLGVGTTIKKCFHDALVLCRRKRIRLSTVGARAAMPAMVLPILSFLTFANSRIVRSYSHGTFPRRRDALIKCLLALESQ